MQLRLSSVSAALVCAAALAGAAQARTCTYATGQCTAAPCPGTTLDQWGRCVLADATAGCPSECTPYNTPDGAVVLCGLESPSATESLSVEDATRIRTCMAAPDAACFIGIASFLETTGCDGCGQELPLIGAANAICNEVQGEAECEMTMTEPECDPVAGAPAPGPAAEMAAPVPTETATGAAEPPAPGADTDATAEDSTEATADTGGASGTTTPAPDATAETSPSGAAGLIGGAFAAVSVFGALLAL